MIYRVVVRVTEEFSILVEAPNEEAAEERAEQERAEGFHGLDPFFSHTPEVEFAIEEAPDADYAELHAGEVIES